MSSISAADIIQVPASHYVEKKKWLDKADELPVLKRDAYKAEIEKVFCTASQILKSIPAKANGIQTLASNHSCSMQKMQQSAQQIFHNFKTYNENQLATLQSLDSLSMRTTSLTLPSTLASMPSLPLQKGFLHKYRRDGLLWSAAIAADIATVMNTGINTSVEYMAAEARAICRSHPAVHQVCVAARDEFVEQVAGTAKIVIQTPLPKLAIKYHDWKTRTIEKRALEYAREYNLPYDMTKDVVSCEHSAVEQLAFCGILTPTKFGAKLAGKLTKNLGKIKKTKNVIHDVPESSPVKTPTHQELIAGAAPELYEGSFTLEDRIRYRYDQFQTFETTTLEGNIREQVWRRAAEQTRIETDFSIKIFSDTHDRTTARVGKKLVVKDTFCEDYLNCESMGLQYASS